MAASFKEKQLCDKLGQICNMLSKMNISSRALFVVVSYSEILSRNLGIAMKSSNYETACKKN